MLTARCSLHTIQFSLFKSQYSLCSLFTSHCSQARKETDQDTKVRNAHVHVYDVCIVQGSTVQLLYLSFTTSGSIGLN